MDCKHCKGCRDDYYNGQGAVQCWLLPKAKLVTRYRIETWTRPIEPGAFTKVLVPDCYHSDGQHYYKDLPSCAVDVVK